MRAHRTDRGRSLACCVGDLRGQRVPSAAAGAESAAAGRRAAAGPRQRRHDARRDPEAVRRVPGHGSAAGAGADRSAVSAVPDAPARRCRTRAARNQQERNQLMNQLQRLTNPRAPVRGDEAMIKERLTALQELESRNAAEMRKAYNALDEVLDVRQQARFRVFEEQIERRKIELLMRARQQNRLNNQQGPKPIHQCDRRSVVSRSADRATATGIWLLATNAIMRATTVAAAAPGIRRLVVSAADVLTPQLADAFAKKIVLVQKQAEQKAVGSRSHHLHAGRNQFLPEVPGRRSAADRPDAARAHDDRRRARCPARPSSISTSSGRSRAAAAGSIPRVISPASCR